MLKTTILAMGLASLTLATVALAQFDGPAPLAWRWVQPTKSAVKGSPVVDGDTVYVAVGQRIFALDKATGNQKWRYPLVEPINGYFNGAPVLVGGVLIGTGDNKMVYGIDPATGQEKWTYTSQMGILGSAVAAGKYAVIAESDNSLMAIDPATGESIWRDPGTHGELPVRMLYSINGGITGFGDNVLVMTSNQELVAISPVTRKPVWTAKFTQLDPSSTPVVMGDDIFINTGGYLASIRGNNGRAAWQKQVGEIIRVAPTPSGDAVLVTTENGKSILYDIRGNLITKKPLELGSYPLTGATVAGNLYVVPTTNGVINLIDPRSGQTLWSYTIRPIGIQFAASSGAANNGPRQGNSGSTTSGPQRIWSVQAAGPAVISGSTLLILAKDGSLLAFDKNTGVDLTGPEVGMGWPAPGDSVSPNQLDVMFKIDDEASGVNSSTIKIDVDGNPLDFKYGKEGVAEVLFSTLSEKNRPLQNGRHTFNVSATDWMGNTTTKSFFLTTDRNLKPLARPAGTTPPGNGPGGNGPGGNGPGGNGPGGNGGIG